MSDPDLSILICTRNRSKSLGETLHAVSRSSIPQGLSAEIVVIDNGSTDDTRDIVRNAARGQLSAVRYVSEPVIGQTRARNCGLKSTTSTAIVFTDDDTRPHPKWIAGMAEELLNKRNDAVAGKVVFPPELESRLPYYVREWFASTDGIDTENPDRMVGANMGFHRRVLSQVPQFDVELGPGGLGFADETLFARQLLKAGFRIKWGPHLVVEHHFNAQRLTRSGLVDLADRMGRSDAYFNYHWLHLDQSWPASYRARLTLSKIANAFGYQRTGPDNLQAMEWQTERAKQRAYLQQYNIERNRRRNYELCGLKKLFGPGAVAEEALLA